MCLVKYGIVTQCLAPTKINDQYLTNVLLKINAKVICTADVIRKQNYTVSCCHLL